VHCSAIKGSGDLWCRLRKLNVHPDISTFVFCHHWSKSSPSLPEIKGADSKLDKQLDFGRALTLR
tara:strand:- start:191 stop:385 length:195 start_codon:yes stop_codon:yes gene_type:complete